MSAEPTPVKESGVTWLTLFASTGTLVRCACPSFWSHSDWVRWFVMCF